MGAGTEAHFERVAIVGCGLLGASFGQAVRGRGLAGCVVGISRRAETIETALRVGAIDEGSRDVQAVVEADLVVLASPVRTIIEHLGTIGGWLRADAIVTDLGSTKRLIVEAAAKLPYPERFVAGHPMAGSDRSGPEHARADLFEGATWLFTPAAGTDAKALARVEGLVTALGATPLRLDPARHDELVAFSSHLPHALAVSLVNASLPFYDADPPLPRLMAGGYRDTSRIAAADPVMWRDIFTTNAPALREAIAAARRELDTLEGALDDPAKLEEWLARASRARRELNR